MNLSDSSWNKFHKSIFVLIIPIFIWVLLHLTLRSKSTEKPIMISHRGAASLAPENTLVSIREAISQGAQFIEVDVRRSADGILSLMHDQTVNRTTNGHGRISELSWEEVSQLDAGSSFSPEFKGEPVPSLDSVLELIKESPANLVLEVKQPSLYPGIELQIAEAIQKSNLNDRITVVSFDHDWLNSFNQVAPDVSLGHLYIFPYATRQIPANRIVDVHWPSVLLDPTLVKRMKLQGHRVWVWTVNNVHLMRLLIWLGVDGITSDRTEIWSEVVGTG